MEIQELYLNLLNQLLIFKVVESGNVPQNEIQITPASILTEIVKSEIIEQISRWRFEAANYIAFAEFDYKIVKQ